MKKRVSLIVLLFCLTGCAKLAHLDQLLTLKDLSENRDAQTKSVEAQNKNFEQLLAALKNDRLKEYPDKKSILKSFGKPVILKFVIDNGQPKEQWIYRYATEYFKSEKIYFYFDEQGNVNCWEHVVPVTETVVNKASDASLIPPKQESGDGQN